MPPNDSCNSSKPFLTVGTTDFTASFQDTDIPPPAPETRAAPRPDPPREVTSPQTPSSLYPSPKNSLVGFGGPLSSHPITPVETGSTEAFPLHDQATMSEETTSGSNGFTKANGVTNMNETNGCHQPHISGDSSDSNNFDPSIPHQPSKDTSRRPSFVSRFMQLRSSSFLRSKSSLSKLSGSTSSLNRTQSGMTSAGSAAPSIMEPSERGVKRPGSPMVGRGGADGAQPHTFPRMVRKKSMELLSTARRKSGMFGRDEMTQSAMDEERAREDARDEYMQDSERSSTALDGQRLEEERRQEEARRLEIAREVEERRKRSPPPTVQLNGIAGGALDGDDMFKDIGR